MPINIKLADTEQAALLQNSIARLTTDEQTTLAAQLQQRPIVALVDGRGLACPMPLLKTKVALRAMQENECVYVLATDPNSQTDLSAFCQQSALPIVLNTQTHHDDTSNTIDTGNTINQAAQPAPSVPTTEGRLTKLDTIFHLIITKTYGN